MTTTSAAARSTIDEVAAPGIDEVAAADREGAGAVPSRPDWGRLLKAVKESGQYPTTREAERITCLVLCALGGHVIGDERVELARRLPDEAARLIASQIPVRRPLTAPEFVDAVAGRIEGATPATARWDVGAVLGTLPALIGEDLTARILRQLPTGYALLFGKAELLTRAA
ncbi:DUF2267 domain-containing protein [Streptomyces sp. TP-A0356]|uniref:DUF2267 domain-containing protein n=1 Tax=Streptomyces sp. TP-A0356 TaxID=1359208 RepID=UPI00099F1773|nr:DUF2267 domain-containing protein [Streptomyces sp. TP-A0356]